MAIGTPVFIGSNTAGVAVTTTALVPAGARVFIVTEDFAVTHSISSVSGGSLTWVVDRNGVNDGNAVNIAIASADAPAGLPTSTTITPTIVGSTVPMAMVFYVTGLAGGASGYLSGTPPTPTAVFATAAWTSPSITTVDADAIVLGFAAADGVTPQSSTASTGTEITGADIHNTGTTEELTGVYRIVSSTGAYTTAGTFLTAADQRRLTVAYKAAPAVAGGLTQPARVWPLMLSKFRRFGLPLAGFPKWTDTPAPTDVVATANAAIGLGITPATVVNVLSVNASSIANGSAPAAVPAVTSVNASAIANGSAPPAVPVDVRVAGAAVANGSAPAAVVNVVSVNASAIAAGSAPAPVPLVVVPVTAALALGITPAPTVIAGGAVIANATVAIALGSAPAPVVLVTSINASAIALGSAPPAVPVDVKVAGFALALGSSPAPTVLVVVPVNPAVALGSTPAPTVISGAGGTVVVSAALAVGSAPAPVVLVRVFPTAALALGSAPAALAGKGITVTAANAVGAVLSPAVLARVITTPATATGATPTATAIAGVFLIRGAVTIITTSPQNVAVANTTSPAATITDLTTGPNAIITSVNTNNLALANVGGPDVDIEDDLT